MAATPESPRLAPLPPREWSKAAGAALAPLLPPTGRPKGGNGPKGLNALGVLARYPELALAYNTFSGQVMYGSTLTPRHRELLVLRVAALRDSEYEWRQHVASAGDNGVDPDEVARVRGRNGCSRMVRLGASTLAVRRRAAGRRPYR